MTTNTALATKQAELQKLATQAQGFIEKAAAENTKVAYGKDWRRFTAWCEGHGVQAAPASPQTVALYLTDMAENGYTVQGQRQSYTVATMTRHLATISRMHQLQGLAFSTQAEPLASTWKGIKRAKRAPQKQKAPLLVDHLRKISEGLPDTLQGRRDRALLLVFFSGAMRRSEVVAFRVEDVAFVEEGVRVQVYTKTTQSGEPETKAIPYGSELSTCPVRSLRRWLEVSGITSGPVFPLSDRQAARIVQKYAAAIGLDATQYGGHSPRAGLVTEAAEREVPLDRIADQTGHKSLRMVQRYVRRANQFKGNAAGRVGL